MTKKYETTAIGRDQEIGEMIGGCETVEEFEQFIKSF